MPIKIFFRIISGYITNEQLIQKLADSYPIRRAAQLATFLIHRSRQSLEDARVKNQQLTDDVKKQLPSPSRFSNRFLDELKKEWQEAQRRTKDRP